MISAEISVQVLESQNAVAYYRGDGEPTQKMLKMIQSENYMEVIFNVMLYMG